MWPWDMNKNGEIKINSASNDCVARQKKDRIFIFIKKIFGKIISNKTKRCQLQPNNFESICPRNQYVHIRFTNFNFQDILFGQNFTDT